MRIISHLREHGDWIESQWGILYLIRPSRLWYNVPEGYARFGVCKSFRES